MPRFFFHCENDLDQEGTVLEDRHEARSEAIAMAGAMLCEDHKDIPAGSIWKMTVADDRGVIVCSLQFTAEFDDAIDDSIGLAALERQARAVQHAPKDRR